MVSSQQEAGTLFLKSDTDGRATPSETPRTLHHSVPHPPPPLPRTASTRAHWVGFARGTDVDIKTRWLPKSWRGEQVRTMKEVQREGAWYWAAGCKDWKKGSEIKRLLGPAVYQLESKGLCACFIFYFFFSLILSSAFVYGLLSLLSPVTGAPFFTVTRSAWCSWDACNREEVCGPLLPPRGLGDGGERPIGIDRDVGRHWWEFGLRAERCIQPLVLKKSALLEKIHLFVTGWVGGGVLHFSQPLHQSPLGETESVEASNR